MLALLLGTLSVLFVAVAGEQAEALQAAWVHAEAQVRASEVRRVAEGVRDYRRETGSYPVSLAVLQASSGQAHLRDVDGAAIRYAVVAGLNDGVRRFDRALVYAQTPDAGLTDVEFLSAGENTCGTNSFSTSTDWCGGDKAHWWRAESRTGVSASLSEQRRAFNTLLQRIANYHAAHGGFPPGVAAGIAATLVALTAYGGTAANCSGVRLWDELPVGCDELYSRWGYPITINVLTDGAVTVLYLVARTDYQTAGGSTVYVSAHLAVET